MLETADRLEAAPLIGADAAATAQALDEALAMGAGAAPGDDTVSVERGRLALRRSELRMAQGDIDGAIEDVQIAGDLLPSGGDSEVRARLMVVRLLARTTKLERAAEVLEQTRADAKSAGRSQAVRLALALATGELALEQRAPAQGFDHLRRAAGIARAPGTEHDLWQAVMGVAVSCQMLNDPGEARPWLERAMQVAAEVDDPRRRSEPAFALGNILTALDPPAHHEDAARAYAIALDGDLSAETRPAAHLGLAQLTLAAGDHDATVDHAVAGAQAAAAVGNPGLFASGAILAAQAQARMARPVESLKTLDAAATALRRQGAEEFAKLVDAAKVEFQP